MSKVEPRPVSPVVPDSPADHDGLTERAWSDAMLAMREAGAAAGHAAATWLVDGNTSDATVRALAKALDDGDPAFPDCPSPFSGEFADGLTIEGVIDAETDLDASSLSPEDQDDLAREFEDAFSEAWWTEAERSIRAALPE